MLVKKMMTRHDDTDKDKRYFRAPERLFVINDDWYFSAREGDQGPYRNEADALVELGRFIAARTELGQFQASRERWRIQKDAEEAIQLEIMQVPTIEPEAVPRLYLVTPD